MQYFGFEVFVTIPMHIYSLTDDCCTYIIFKRLTVTYHKIRGNKKEIYNELLLLVRMFSLLLGLVQYYL